MHFPQVARTDREEVLPPELEEIRDSTGAVRTGKEGAVPTTPDLEASTAYCFSTRFGPTFMESELQNPTGAAGVLTMPIDSQSPWPNAKTERAGQSFKHQLWDMDEECHIEGKMDFEAVIADCCDARNRYCNRSGFSAHHRVFGSSLRLPGSL